MMENSNEFQARVEIKLIKYITEELEELEDAIFKAFELKDISCTAIIEGII